MRKDYRLKENCCFYLSFRSKSRTQWQTNLNKASLLEQIFRLVEISFKNHILLCVVAVSCRNKLLMQNLIPANINLILASENHSLLLFQTLLPPKATFKTCFSTNPSFRLVETYFLPSRNSMLLFGAFFLLLETMIEIRWNQF